jgi:thioredoxin-related protein
MKKIFILIILLLSFFCSAHAQDSEKMSTEPMCTGNWVLKNIGGWMLQNESGVLLPVSGSTEIYGCDQKKTPLTNDLSGVQANIICAPSPVENGLPDIVSIYIICK